jgi:hypothetical protein
MERDPCACKKCKYYHYKCRCKSKRHKKKLVYESTSSQTSNSDSNKSLHRNQSIKIKVDCNRGLDDTIKPKQYIKSQELDYKDEFLKYLLTNSNTNTNTSAKLGTQQQNTQFNQNNIKFISGIISPCFDNINLQQIGCGYTAEFIHTSTNDQWIIKIEHCHIINFIVSEINNIFSNNVVIDSSSLETSINRKPRFLNRIVINVKEPLIAFSFIVLCI